MLWILRNLQCASLLPPPHIRCQLMRNASPQPDVPAVLLATPPMLFGTCPEKHGGYATGDVVNEHLMPTYTNGNAINCHFFSDDPSYHYLPAATTLNRTPQ